MGMIEIDDAVKIFMSRQGDIDLEPAIEGKLQKAVDDVKRLKQLMWNSSDQKGRTVRATQEASHKVMFS